MERVATVAQGMSCQVMSCHLMNTVSLTCVYILILFCEGLHACLQHIPWVSLVTHSWQQTYCISLSELLQGNMWAQPDSLIVCGSYSLCA